MTRLRTASSNRRVFYLLLLAVAVFLLVEAVRGSLFILDVRSSKTQLQSIRNDLDISRLQQPEGDVLSRQKRLRAAQHHLGRAKGFVNTDPILAVAKLIPVADKQAAGMSNLILAADQATRTGLKATDVQLAFTRYQRDPSKTSIQDALGFLKSEESDMTEVNDGLQRLKARRDSIGEGLIGPMSSMKSQLSGAIEKLDGLVTGYERADRLLPDILGYDGSSSYLVLPQNNTELFPSGGLISSYGIAKFEGGKLVSMNLEYFGTLFDRWQAQTHEYVEPPQELKNFLKHDYSWGLGESGWYPDFPTTSGLARSFVTKGGAPQTDGVIAIDLQFISELLKVLGPVGVPEYDVTVTDKNVTELTLEQTRDETYVPGQPRKAFLSFLSKAVLTRVFAIPKDKWVDMLKLLDRMGRERHLQINFADPTKQALIASYGFDGAIDSASGGEDYLLITDTSVNSTKLNLILGTKARLDLELQTAGSAHALLNYQVSNPFPEWQKGRDPALVKLLMLDGIYGCYLRLYTNSQASLADVRVQNQAVGPQQNEPQLDKRVFGRFFTVAPGANSTVQFAYQTPGVVQKIGDRSYYYELLVQKEAGTNALPIDIRVLLPIGATLQDARLDGRSVGTTTIATDLRTDRRLEVWFSTS